MLTTQNLNSTQYPARLFPELAFRTFQELSANTQTPASMIGAAILAAMAYGCQGRVTIRTRASIELNTSIGLATLAESGERKSTLDKLTTRSIHALQAETMARHNRTVASSMVEAEIRSAQLSMLRAELKEALHEGDCTKKIEAELERLFAEAQDIVEPPQLIFGDFTAEGLLYSLHKGWRSAIVLASEGGIFLKGHAIKRMSQLNMLATGEPVPVARKTAPTFFLKDAKLTVSLMVQPGIFEKFIALRGDSARFSGMWTRYLISHPASTRGSRFIYTPDMHWDHLDAFNDRIRLLLEDPREPGTLLEPNTRVLDLDVQAQQLWVDFSNAVEAELAPWGFLADVPDYGSRIAEMVARIAAIFHEFQGFMGPVGVDCMQRAIEFGRWYLCEFLSIFGAGGREDPATTDARKLISFLNTYARRQGQYLIKKSHLLQHGPVRSSALLLEALDIMHGHNMVQGKVFGRTTWVELNPAFFGGSLQAQNALFQLKDRMPPLPFSDNPYRHLFMG